MIVKYVFNRRYQYWMRFEFVKITSIIIDYYLFDMIKIFDRISFSIWRMFHSADLVLQSFVVITFNKSEVNNVLDVIFFLLIDYHWRWWWKNCINISFERFNLKNALIFFSILNDSSILWFNFLNNRFIWMFLVNNHTWFSTW